MKKILKLKLNQLDKDELSKREQLELHGGDNCSGYCIPSNPSYPESNWQSTYTKK
jgi:natural product precursor